MESDGLYYTNRCGNAHSPGCNRALTKLEIIEALRSATRRSICPCGSNGFRSSNFKWWEEWLLPRSWWMKWGIYRGTVPPPPSKVDTEARDRSMVSAISRMEADLADLPGEEYQA